MRVGLHFGKLHWPGGHPDRPEIYQRVWRESHVLIWRTVLYPRRRSEREVP